MTLERKLFTVTDIKLDGKGKGTLSVAFAQLNVIDHDGDISLTGSFPDKSVPMSDWGHTSWYGAPPTGRGAIHEDGNWAVFDGSYFLSTTQGANAYETVKGMDDLQEWSYGYEPIEFAFEQRDGATVRLLKRQDVFEVSPVLRGAGIETHTLGIKSGGPGPGLPFADHLALVAEEVKAIAARTKDRAEFRAKEGRSLSSDNRDRLKALADSLDEQATTLRSLLADGDPDPAASADAALQIQALVEEARFLGVAVD